MPLLAVHAADAHHLHDIRSCGKLPALHLHRMGSRRQQEDSSEQEQEGDDAAMAAGPGEEDGDEDSLPDEVQPGGADAPFTLPAHRGPAGGLPPPPAAEREWGAGGPGEDGVSMTSGDESLSQADDGEKHYHADFRWAAGQSGHAATVQQGSGKQLDTLLLCTSSNRWQSTRNVLPAGVTERL